MAGNPPGFGPHSDILNADAPASVEACRTFVEEIKNRGRGTVQSKSYKDADALYTKAITVLTNFDVKKEGAGKDDDDDAGKKTKDESAMEVETATAAAKESEDLTWISQELAILHSNRSLVRLGMTQADGALDDAQMAIAYDATYTKAYWRCGQAHVKLRNEDAALAAYEQAANLEPSNAAIRKERDRLRKAVQKKDDAPVEEKKEEKAKTETKPKPPSKPKAAAKKTKEAEDDVDDDDEDKLFSKSDHVRGYKIVGGKKTSYFHRELSEKEKQLIGNTAPKRLDAAGASGPALLSSPTPQPIAAPAPLEGTSAWNKAGTWEERDITSWAQETLKSMVLKASFVLPESSPAPGVLIRVTSVKSVEGHSSVAVVRGKKRYIFEFALSKIAWEMDLPEEDKPAKGSFALPDVDGTGNPEEGYDVAEFTVDSSSPTSSRPLVDGFVRNGGLRNAVFEAIGQWIALLKETY